MSMTTDESTIVEAEAFRVRRSIRIDAPVARVWQAVTEPAMVSQWFGELALPAVEVGATGTISWPDHGSIPIGIKALDEPRSVTYVWNNDHSSSAYPAEFDESEAMTFTFTLQPEEGGTRLTVVETGFETTHDPAANMEDHRGGWDYELDELRALLTSGADAPA
jgi:uncharacterized protein YndB with AHSA1/START domain